MGNAFRLSNLAASAAAGDGTNKGFGAYAGAGAKIMFYVGAQNTTPESAPAGLLLGTVAITGSYGSASNGAITTSTIASATAGNSGTAASFWHTQSNSTTPLADGTVGATSGYDINFDNNVIVSGGTIAMSSMTVTFPPH